MFGKMSVGVREITIGLDQQNQQRQNDKGIRPRKRNLDNPHS